MPHGGDSNADQSVGWEGEAPAEPKYSLYLAQSEACHACNGVSPTDLLYAWTDRTPSVLESVISDLQVQVCGAVVAPFVARQEPRPPNLGKCRS